MAKASCKEGAYVTPAGWLEGEDGKVRRLTLKALQQGSNHSRVKVGVAKVSLVTQRSAGYEEIKPGVKRSDLRRREIIRVDLTNLSKRWGSPSVSSIDEKNAGPTRNVLMIDSKKV